MYIDLMSASCFPRHDVSKASKELSEVKEMYVMVCKQKDELEEILKKNWNEETEKQMKKVM